MKKFILLLLLSFPIVCSAQWKVGIGASGLVNRYFYEDESYFESKYDIGYSGNIYLERTFTPVFGVSIEPSYLVKGGKVTYQGVDFKSKTGYASVPVLANLHFLRIFTLAFGPEFSTKLTQEYSTSDPAVAAKEFYNNEFKDYEVSALAGLYFKILPKMDFGLRYSFAITNSGKFRPEDFSSENIKENAAKGKYAQFMLRIIFN
ncbi:outer membrane beta-barrel protein [Luteibaculum oceani]|uniref:PorT family protein n=1 Tax=Luteibaculum oceani TaxID=1294296 RepID=A0A5C6VNW8_9FLAO|nr:outer membrane beta-barrel protein [Luteibaculum oceani]TXC85395.1 PorT family protein [Luteibaculum oceani]